MIMLGCMHCWLLNLINTARWNLSSLRSVKMLYSRSSRGVRSKSELVVTVKRVEEFLVLCAGEVGWDEMFRITKFLRGPLANRSSPFLSCIARNLVSVHIFLVSSCERHNNIYVFATRYVQGITWYFHYSKSFFFFLDVILLSSTKSLFQTKITWNHENLDKIWNNTTPFSTPENKKSDIASDKNYLADVVLEKEQCCTG